MKKFEINFKSRYIVFFNHTLDEYNKLVEKYNNKHKDKPNTFLNVSKAQVESGGSNINLLAKKRWWLINDTYYEMPPTWFGGLKTKYKLIIAGSALAGIICAIVLPIVLSNKVGSNFDDYVNFNDTRLTYDRNEHAVKFTIKEGKELPSNTSIKYYYQQETRTGDQCFSFTDAGNYQVKLELKAPKFNVFNKTINYIIDKAELSNDQKGKIKFSEVSKMQKIGSVQAPQIENTSGEAIVSASDCEYSTDGSNWTKVLPTAKNTYYIRKTLSFKNYKDYIVNDLFYIDEANEIRVTFNVSANGGKWGSEEGATNEAVTTSAIHLGPGNKISFQNFIDDLEIKKPGLTPTKEGHAFDQKWANSTGQYKGSDEFTYSEGADLTFKALFTIKEYQINFDSNGGGTVQTPSIWLEYNKPILENITQYEVPSHPNGKFKGWGETADSKETISSKLKMPASDKTLYAVWYKYDFEFIDGDGGTATTAEGVDLKNKISLDAKPAGVTITPNIGYEFNNKYDVYYGSQDIKIMEDFSFGGSNKIAPGLQDITDDNGVNFKIKIKPKFDSAKIKAVIDPDGGVVKKDEKEVTSLDINCGDNILPYLQGLTITKDHTIFKNKWQLIEPAKTPIEITGDTLMPATAVTIKPIYHTYTINVLGDNNVTIDPTTNKFTNRIALYNDEIKYTFTNGYQFKEFEYSLDGSDYQSLEDGMPFMPYDYDSSSESLHDTVYLKVISEPALVDTMEVFLDAGEGNFPDGKNYQALIINKGKTLKEILETTGKPKKGSIETGTAPNHWVDVDNNTINLETPITGVSSYYARAIYTAEVN